MDLQLVKMSEKYKSQLFDMMDEWTKTGETIIPWAIRKVDYHDFDAYLKSLEESEPKEGYVPASTFFAYDRERDILVGAVDIRHSLNEALLLDGGHIGDGVRPSERRKGYATESWELKRYLWYVIRKIPVQQKVSRTTEEFWKMR